MENVTPDEREIIANSLMSLVREVLLKRGISLGKLHILGIREPVGLVGIAVAVETLVTTASTNPQAIHIAPDPMSKEDKALAEKRQIVLFSLIATVFTIIGGLLLTSDTSLLYWIGGMLMLVGIILLCRLLAKR